ncbi:MAG: PAS domain S-box protein, partial [Candidatus Aminicenantales bacterium]
DGRPLFVQSVVRDISERKHAIEKLRESRELYKTLMETSPDAVTATDLKGTITYASRRTAELYGVKDAAQMVGKNALDFIAPEDRERALENMKKTLEKGTVREVMYRGLRKDGSVFISELNASLIRDAHGKPKAFIATTRDVTERRRIQEQLAQSEQRFRSLVESANDAIYIITPEGFEYVNPAFEKLTGYSSKQVCQKNFNFWNIIHPDDVTMIQQREEARKRGEEVPSRYEFRILAKNGKVKVVEPATVNIGEKGEARVMGILRDVTERKRAEDILRTSLEEKEVLLREIHHRVKNNMQIISSLLRLQARTIKDPRMQEMFKESQNRIRSMALIHEKLYQTEDLTRINFAQYIRSLTVHLFHTYKVNPNIVRINTRVDDIFLDINRAIPCGLVVNELVSNSLKHAFPDGRKGEIRILLTREKRKKVRLVVGDNGVGLPQEVDHRDPRTLGLQLVYDLVRQLDGKIRLDRTKGSTFVITFQA